MSRDASHLTVRSAVVELSVVIALIVFAGAIRLHRVTADSLDIDEGFSLWIAQHSLYSLWNTVAALDDHPPLFYMLLHVWVRLWGDEELALRGLPVLLGTLTVPAICALGRIVGGLRLGAMTGLLFALSPYNVQWNQEVRMYSLEVFAIALAMMGLALVLREAHSAEPKERLLGWSVYSFGVIGAVWSAYGAFWVPVASALISGWTLWTIHIADGRRRFATEWGLAHCVIIVLCIPIALLLLHQLRGPNVVNWYTFTWRTLVGTFGTVFAGAAFVGSPARYIVYTVGLAMFTLGLAGWIREPKWNILVLSLGLVPFVGAILISRSHPVFAQRSFLWTFLPLALAVGKGVLVLRPRVLSLAALLSLVIISLSGLGRYWHDRSEDALRGYDQAAVLVASSAQRDDILLFYVPYAQPTFDYYFRRYHLPLEEYGVPVTLGDGPEIFPPLTFEDMPRVQRLLKGHPRVWFVRAMLPSAEVILDTLSDHGTLVSSHTVNDALRVYLYDLRR